VQKNSAFVGHNEICDWKVYISHNVVVQVRFDSIVSSRHEFFRERPAAEFLCKFCSSVGSDLDVGGIDLMK